MQCGQNDATAACLYGRMTTAVCPTAVCRRQNDVQPCYWVTIAVFWYSFPLKLKANKKSNQLFPCLTLLNIAWKIETIIFDRELDTGGLRGLEHCCNEFGYIDSYYFHWNRSKYDVLFECLTGTQCVWCCAAATLYMCLYRVSYTTRKLFFLASWPNYKITVQAWINSKVQVLW